MIPRQLRKTTCELFTIRLVLPRDAEIRAIHGEYETGVLSIWFTTAPDVVDTVYRTMIQKTGDHLTPDGAFEYIGIVYTNPNQAFDGAIHYYLECDP